MFLGTNMPGDPGEPREATRRRQEIHWDYDKKGLPSYTTSDYVALVSRN